LLKHRPLSFSISGRAVDAHRLRDKVQTDSMNPGDPQIAFGEAPLDLL
jgi:hypothetical protein